MAEATIDQKKLATLNSKLGALSKKYAVAETTVQAIGDRLFQSLPETVKFMQKPGLADAYLNLNVIYQVKTSAAEIEFSFSFDKRSFENLNGSRGDLAYFKVCLSPSKDQQIPCSQPGGVKDAKVEFDASLKQLTITKDVLGSPRAWGLGSESAADSESGSFNKLNQLKLEQSKLVIKVAHGNLDQFEFTSGSILFYDHGDLWHEGSFSLLP